MGQQRLTLIEIAAEYHRHPKTFRKYVLKLDIPHVKLGRDMLFDRDQVRDFLESLGESKLRVDLKRKTVSKKPARTGETKRYRDMLGIN
ncbi:MAG: hypothetical protein ACK4S4_16035 [Pyrinomonadaceae bacterium]